MNFETWKFILSKGLPYIFITILLYKVSKNFTSTINKVDSKIKIFLQTYNYNFQKLDSYSKSLLTLFVLFVQTFVFLNES